VSGIERRVSLASGGRRRGLPSNCEKQLLLFANGGGSVLRALVGHDRLELTNPFWRRGVR
jgi:hypothetical protein